MPENNELAWEDDELFLGGSAVPETKSIEPKADDWGDDELFEVEAKAPEITNAQGFTIPPLSGSNPALSRAEKDYQEKTGGTFLGRLENNVSIAAKNVQRSYYGMKMSEFAGVADLYKSPKYTPEFFEKNPKQKVQLESALENYMDNAAEFIQIGLDQQKENATRPALEKVMRKQGDRSLGDKALEIVDGVTDDPLGVVGDLTIQSMPMMLEAIATVTAIKGAGGSNRVAALGGGAVSGLNEFGSDYAQLRLEGRSHNEAWGAAATRAGIIGLFDAVSFKTAGSALEEILDATIGNKLKATAKETGQQMSLGAGGEFVGTEASGRDAELGDVAAEAIGEVGGVFIEGPAMLARRRPKDGANSPDPEELDNGAPLDADSEVFGTEQVDAPIDLTEADTGESLALPAPTMEVGADGVAATTAQREQAEAEKLANEDALGIEEGDRKAIARHAEIDAQSPAAARRTMQKRLPDNFTDPRLGRDTYRDAIKNMVETDFTEGGGVALIPDENFVRGEGDGENVPLRRTPSVNPDWAQAILQEEEVSVKDVRNAVDAALSGNKLGVRQSRVVTSLLDQTTGERTDVKNIESVQAARKEAQDLRKIARGEFVPDEAYEDVMADYAGEIFEENNYDPMWDGEARSFYEVYDEAVEVNPEAAESLFEGMYQADTDLPSIARALYAQVINQEPIGEQYANGANTADAGLLAGANPAGQGNGIQADFAPEIGAGFEPEPAIGRSDRSIEPITEPAAPGAEGQLAQASNIAQPVMSETVPEVDTEQAILNAADDMQAEISGRRDHVEPVADDKRQGERRTDIDHRKDIETMSDDEKTAELEKLRTERLQNPKTKISGRTAFEEDAKLGWENVAALDGDGVGFFNDIIGHDPTDEILKAFATEIEKFNTDKVRFYHLNGDEFSARGENTKDLIAQSDKVQKHLEGIILNIDTLLESGERLDVEIAGLGISYGIGDSYESADIEAGKSKRDRERAGQRAEKGSNPGGIKVANKRSGRESSLGERGDSKDRALEVIEETGKNIPPDKQHPGLKKPKATSEIKAAPKGVVSASGDVKKLPGKKLKPDDFIQAPDGSINYGEITPEIAKEIGRQKGVIRLQNGDKRFGLNHILKRLKQLIDRNYQSVESFVYELASNFDEIRKGDAGRIILVKKPKDGGRTGDVLIIELQPEADKDGDYYSAITGLPMSYKRVEDKYNLLWGRGARRSVDSDNQLPLPAQNQEGQDSAANAQDKSDKPIVASDVKKKHPGQEQTTNSVETESKSVVDEAASEAATSPENNLPEPTEAQKEAGNYKVGKTIIQGLPISIENPKGSTRTGKDSDGETWESTMTAHYGYIRKTEGADGDHVDVFIGDKPESEKVFVIDQINPSDKSFDEHKVILGATSKMGATKLYNSNYDAGWKGKGAITAMSMDEFKQWLEGDTTKPVAYKQKLHPGKNKVESKPSQETAPEAKKVTEPVNSSAQDISDFGSELKGAAKHYAAAYAEKMKNAKDIDIESVPLAKAWPEPNYQKLIDEGADPWVVAHVRAARDSVPAKSRKGWKLKRYVDSVKGLRNAAEEAIKLNKAFPFVAVADLTHRIDMLGVVDLYVAVGHDKSLKGLNLTKGEYSLLDGKTYSPPKIIYTVEKKGKGVWPTKLAAGDTKQEALDNFKKVYGSLGSDKQKSKEIKFGIYSSRADGNIYIGKKIGRDVIKLESFDSSGDARKYLEENHDKLVKKLEKFKVVPNERRESNEPRIGDDHRNGADITTEQFADTFGFRGGQFGNSILKAKGEAQKKLNDAYDALIDLSIMLGIPPKALSLNGELGLAFGARGKGGKNAPAAHYEPNDKVTDDRVIINLTRKNGAGSLAHEWFHALDNYFTRMRGDRGVDRYLTENPYHDGKDGVRPKAVAAFKQVVDAIDNTGLAGRSNKLDVKRTKAYWATVREMAARSFESYVVAKLQDQGKSNDFLANIVDEKYWKATEELGMELEGSYPYPNASEINDVRAAFDNLFETLETKETDKGTMLFSKRKATKSGLSVSKVKKTVSRISGKWKNAPDIEIVQYQKELPNEILDHENDGDVIEGVFHNGRVYLVADNLRNEKHLEFTLLHESLLHYGARETFGAAEFDKILNTIWVTNKEVREAAAKKVIQFGLNQNDAVEEVLADMAGNGKAQKLSGWKRLVQFIKQWLSKRGFLNINTDEFVNYVLSAARNSVENGKARGNADYVSAYSKQGPDNKFSKAYHGTPHEFNEFSLGAMGTGEGRQANAEGQPMFSRNTDPSQTGENDTNKEINKSLTDGQPVDMLFRKAFEIAKIPKVTKAIHDKGVKYLTEAKFSEDSPMSWLNGPLETARGGLIDRHGLEEKYVQRDFKREADKRKIELKAVDSLKSIAEHVSNPQEAAVLQAVLTGEKIPEGDWAGLAAPIREAIDDLGREAMELGLISRESYEKNKGSYLHRVYKGHESSQTKLGSWVSSMSATRRKRIRGDELKARGMTIKTGMDKLLSSMPKDWWGSKEQDGKADKALKGKEFYVFDRLSHTGEGTGNLPGMGEKQTGKLKDRVYWPADKPVPKKYEAWEARGKWEVRDVQGNKIVLWRDFTKEERTNMGEILDARYTMTKTFMLMAHDLSTGRFLKDIAQNDNWANKERPAVADEFIEDNPERRRGVSVYSDVVWVKVPSSSVGGASVKKWGALAGMYVRSEIWRDLNELDRMQMPNFWKSILTQWKLNKTARNPVVHMNNVMSNLIFMDMADIRWIDLKRAIISYKDKDEDYQDALENGAFGASYIEHEIRRDILDPIIEEIMNQDKALKKGAVEAYMDDKEMLAKMSVLGKMFDSGFKGAKWADKKMTDAYQFEDEIFRLATYIRRKSLGDDKETPIERFQ